MFKNLARASVFTLAAMSAVAAPTRPPLKVAFVYVSPIGEAGWTYQHEQGRLEMQKALGASVSSSIVEGVAEGADSERVIRDLARQGNQLIFATSFGYLDATLRVAADFPDVKFEHAGGYKTASNVNTYNARYYEARYLAGVLAGRTSKSGVAGYVAGFPVPEVVQGINAFTLGMREVNPKAQVRVIWVNTWFDPAREGDAAQTLINQGADVLSNHSGSPAVPQIAQANFRAKGVRVIGYQSDMRLYAPDAQLAAITLHWGGYYIQVAKAVQAGTWKAQPVWGGMKDGLLDLSPIATDVPSATRALIETRRKSIIDGSLKPFAAPLTDNEGHLRLAKGSLDDAAIGAMNWFVEGVVGSVPKP
jgi:simple sugar transport system substrate-binding protein